MAGGRRKRGGRGGGERESTDGPCICHLSNANEYDIDWQLKPQHFPACLLSALSCQAVVYGRRFCSRVSQGERLVAAYRLSVKGFQYLVRGRRDLVATRISAVKSPGIVLGNGIFDKGLFAPVLTKPHTNHVRRA